MRGKVNLGEQFQAIKLQILNKSSYVRKADK